MITTELAVRTSAPILPLSRMVSGTALITRHDDLHLITGLDPESVKWVAKTLVILGYEADVVVAESAH